MATNPGLTKKRTKQSNPQQLNDTKNVTSKRPRETPVTLTFKLDPEFHKEFKKYAVVNDFPSMQQLFKDCFEYYKDNH